MLVGMLEVMLEGMVAGVLEGPHNLPSSLPVLTREEGRALLLPGLSGYISLDSIHQLSPPIRAW